MNTQREHLEDIQQIRAIMERSTTFVSLTGLSGVMAGIYGLITLMLTVLELDTVLLSPGVLSRLAFSADLRLYLGGLAVVALVVTLVTAFLLTFRKARQRRQAVWDSVSRRFALQLFAPLVAGGWFAIVLVHLGVFELVCPAMLIFFGLALVGSARFVVFDTMWLGLVEIALGLAASIATQYGLILWGLGFGVATLIYGMLMYVKYER